MSNTLTLMVLLIGLASSVYLVQSSPNFLPQAKHNQPVTETSLSLSSTSRVSVGKTLPVKVLIRSDIDAANLVAVKLKFPVNLLTVISITKDKTTIKTWVEEYYDNQTGEISLIAAVPNPGFKTDVGKNLTLATINFRAKAKGKTTISFLPDSAIYRNSDSLNILTTTRNLSFTVK